MNKKPTEPPALHPALLDRFFCFIDRLEKEPGPFKWVFFFMIGVLILGHHQLHDAGIDLRLPPLMVIPLSVLSCVLPPRQMLWTVLGSSLLWVWVFALEQQYHYSTWLVLGNTLTFMLGMVWLCLLVMHLKKTLIQQIHDNQVDPLTQTLNLRAFEALSPSRQLCCHRNCKPLTLVFIDLDHFKQLNDRCGHQIGNQVLVSLSHSMRGHLPEDGLCARFGGDEFVLLLPGLARAQAVNLLESIRDEFERRLLPLELAVTLSMGGVSFDWPLTAQPLVKLISAADAQMYRVKHQGRNQICVVDADASALPVPA